MSLVIAEEYCMESRGCRFLTGHRFLYLHENYLFGFTMNLHVIKVNIIQSKCCFFLVSLALAPLAKGFKGVDRGQKDSLKPSNGINLQL